MNLTCKQRNSVMANYGRSLLRAPQFPTHAAASFRFGRKNSSSSLWSCCQVTEALDLAQRLGLTVMRMWAFTDGSDQFMPLQPQQGRLDPEIFACVPLYAADQGASAFKLHIIML